MSGMSVSLLEPVCRREGRRAYTMQTTLHTQKYGSMKTELHHTINRQLITKICELWRLIITIMLVQYCIPCVDQHRSEHIIPYILLYGRISVPRKGVGERLWSWRLNMSHPVNIALYSSTSFRRSKAVGQSKLISDALVTRLRIVPCPATCPQFCWLVVQKIGEDSKPIGFERRHVTHATILQQLSPTLSN